MDVGAWDFNGTINISHDPIMKWEVFAASLLPKKCGGWPCYEDVATSDRAEGGYYRSTFRIIGDWSWLNEMFYKGLGRHVEICDPFSGAPFWKGKIMQMALTRPGIVLKMNLENVFNRVWMKYRLTGSAVPVNSTAFVDAYSAARYAYRDYVLCGGELESAAVADQLSRRVLQLSRTPKPMPEPITEMKSSAEFYMDVTAFGYYDTLAWQVYDQTAIPGAQAASLQVANIITAKGQFVSTSEINSNATSVSRVYGVSRSAGNIISDIARLGDSLDYRWLARMNGTAFKYAKAAPPNFLDNPGRAIKYYLDINDPLMRIRNWNGATVPPWLVTADAWMMIPGIRFITVNEEGDFSEIPELLYLEEVNWKMGQNIPQIKNNRGQQLDVILSRMSARSTV